MLTVIIRKIQGKWEYLGIHRPSTLLCLLHKLRHLILPTTLWSRTTVPTLHVWKLRRKDGKKFALGKKQRTDLYPNSSDSTFLSSQTALEIFNETDPSSEQWHSMVGVKTRIRPNRPTIFAECLSFVRRYSRSLSPWSSYPARGKETINIT